MKFDRSIPYFNALVKATSAKRINILRSFPSFVLDDLLEILFNIVRGTRPVSRAKYQVLNKHKKQLLDIVNSRYKNVRRRIIYKQGGGFLGSLIPIVLSTVAGIVADKFL